jgi:hypothetical protein
MPTLDAAITKTHKEAARLLRITRHRVTRWFRPAVAVARHHPSALHPMLRPVAARPEPVARGGVTA